MLRSLIHHWRINLAVIAGAAVATAVLAGAVIIGDSMQASLRRLTLDRLGDIDWALASEETVRAALVDEIESSLAAGPGGRAAPMLAATASAAHSKTRSLASGVRLFGVDERKILCLNQHGIPFYQRLKEAPISYPIHQPTTHRLLPAHRY
jgi:hypothetical protein